LSREERPKHSILKIRYRYLEKRNFINQIFLYVQISNKFEVNIHGIQKRIGNAGRLIGSYNGSLSAKKEEGWTVSEPETLLTQSLEAVIDNLTL
jgi:hypothetical protein